MLDKYLTSKGRLFFRRPLAFAGFAIIALFAGIAGYQIWFSQKSENKSIQPAKAAVVNTALISKSSISKSNVTIDLLLSPNLESSNFGHKVADVQFALRDEASGEFLRGRRVMAWMNLEDDPKQIAETDCKEAIKSRLAGGLTAQAGVNLNQWNLFAMNDDNTLSMINPQVSFSKTKLRQLITMAGYPVDWMLNRSGSKLFVSISSKGLISVIDSLKGKIEKNISVGGKPVRVRSGLGTIVVGNDDSDEIHLIDDVTGDVVATIDVGNGHKEIAISPDGKLAIASAADDNEIVLIDLQSHKKLDRYSIPEGITGLAFTSQGVAFAVNERLGKIFAGVGGKFNSDQHFDVGIGAAVIGVSGNGRWVFIGNPVENKVDIFNASTFEKRYTVKGLVRPDQIQMTEDFAYLRSSGKAGVVLVRIDSLDRQGQPVISEVQMGTLPPNRSSDQGIAAAMTPSPEGSAMIIANPADKTIYFYQEGMMAPAGTMKNYGRQPRSVLVADWSLHESEPGHYQTRAIFPRGGRYDAYVLLSDPRIGVCMKVDVPQDMAMPGLDVETSRELILKTAWNSSTRITAGAAATMEFAAILKEGSKENNDLLPEDLVVRSFVPPVGPAENLKVRRSGKGYAVDFVPAVSGQMTLLLGAPSKGIDFTRRASVTVGVVEGKSVSKVRNNVSAKSL
jgi:DNA-binding beta-propeller fold protein YncE